MSITSTVIDRAEIRFHPATAELQPYVGCFWVITAACGATVQVVPDGTTSLAFEQRQDQDSEGYLRGPLLRPVELKFSAPTSLIGVRLRPGVLFNLIGTPAHSLLGHRIDLRDIDALRELAGAAPHTAAERIATLQDFLVKRLPGTSLHPAVATALDAIHAAQGCISVPAIAVRCGVSERYLSLLMRDWIGYGPKRYAGVIRFQAALGQMQRAPRVPVAELAAETGYFDQSHLHLDVARYAGDTPGRLISQRASAFSKTQCDVPL